MPKTKGFIFDYSKCVGCHACMVACFIENGTKPPLNWRQVNHFNKEKLPLLGFVHQSVACNHCKEAPCLKACPSNAFFFDEKTGAVLHNENICVGCKYCTWACPFDAPKYNVEKGVIEKCHLCYHRLELNEVPACALNCPTGALSFGEIEEKPHPEAFGFTNKNIFPRIKVIGSEIVNSITESNLNAVGVDAQRKNRFTFLNEKPRINSINEWSLALFTYIVTYLIGWIWAMSLTNNNKMSIYFFITLGIIAMIISVLHLGKPFRAYLSIKNLRSSWLSREIALFGVFMVFGTIALSSLSSVLLYITSFIGLLFLISVEMIYSITQKKFQIPIHSANTIFSALTFCALFSQSFSVLIALLALKTLLFSSRWLACVIDKISYSALFAFIRIMVGLIFPLGFLTFTENKSFWWLVAFITIGELIDRFLYYNDIEAESQNRFIIYK
jgi:Fe-S-cluster-containing dehydrogenase component